MTLDLNAFISPSKKAELHPCFVTTGRYIKDDDGDKVLNIKLEFIKKSQFDQYELFSKGRALIPVIKKIKCE